MTNKVISDFKLGVLGGGQLGKMLTLAASQWGLRTAILDAGQDMPAAPVCQEFVQGDFRDFETVYRFGKTVDLLTIEIEQINIDALEKLEKEGVRVFPSPANLRVIQDKAVQTQFLIDQKIPKPAYLTFSSPAEIRQAIDAGKVRFPFVQKLRKFGYDGRGVRVIRSEKDLSQLLEGETMTEDCVAIDKELSVIVARNSSGEVAAYPAVEMVFNPEANLVDYLVCPAEITPAIEKEAEMLAKKIAGALNLIGILAVEMFLDKQGKLWVNELAPRPHNSGHQTIESSFTSQYEQHLRAILNFPLGSTATKMPSVMINLLGEAGFSGPAVYEGLKECLAIEGVKIHIYGKKETRPFRKMGHVTVLDFKRERALEKARRVRQTIKVKA
ncbi:MAG TPA: 5-(carboxyamino)imidazole ribonucleotide synthase [Candidatus Omnitrophota bacterium]|nr:5-(carboxyamino)imidazole ribonucleotide synthase [Candidatus Omnitrophota bacterium]